MPNCKHYQICGRDALGGRGDPLCILHSHNQEKDKKAFDEALAEHRKEKGDHFDHFVFPELADFSNTRFTEDAVFWMAKFNGKANFDDAEFIGEACFWLAEFLDTASFGSAQVRCDSQLSRDQFQ